MSANMPSTWQAKAAEEVTSLIRKIGIYTLGGHDGCPCTNFEVRNIHVDVSCHKSEKTVRVYSHHLDWTDNNYRQVDAALEPVANEVLRQVDDWYGAGGEYAADFEVKYCSWEQERAR